MRPLLTSLVALLGLFSGPLAAQTPGQSERRLILQRLEQTMIEEVKFEEATLNDWVSFLKAHVSAGQRPVNFVVTPAAVRFAAGKTASFELRQVPARVVLDYGARLLGVEIRIESHAVVITAPLVVQPPAPAVPNP